MWGWLHIREMGRGTHAPLLCLGCKKQDPDGLRGLAEAPVVAPLAASPRASLGCGPTALPLSQSRGLQWAWWVRCRLS